MSRAKVAIVVLVLVAIVFVSTLGVGFSQGSDRPSANPSIENAEQPPAWTKSMGAVLSPFAPKIELDTDIFKMQANQAFVDPRTGRDTVLIPRSQKQLRTGTFRLAAGEAVELIYTDKTEKAPDDFRLQDFLLTPSADENEQKIIALESGGELTMRCVSMVDCRVLLGTR